jgi:hypothetical protein
MGDAQRAGLAERFRRAERSFPTSALYRRLVTGVSGDDDLLALAAQGRPGQAPEFLLLGAVHYLLGRSPDHPLASWYPDLHDPVTAGDAFPAFRSFCLDHRDEVAGLVATRLVQTNEPRRSAALLRGLGVVRGRDPRPLALVEVGASAGLNLLFDRYRYRFGAGLEAGAGTAPVVIDCAAVGALPPPVPATMPTPARRVGMDLHPVDVADPEAVEWLSALLSPEDAARRRLLLAACRLAGEDRPEVVAGDVFDVLPRLVADLPAGMPVCVFHSSVLFHFPAELRPAFGRMVTALAADRDVHWLSLEGAGTTHRLPQPVERNHQVLGLTSITARSRSDRLLALFDPHGGWVEWLAGPEPG